MTERRDTPLDEAAELKAFKAWMDAYSPDWMKYFTPGEMEPLRHAWFASAERFVRSETALNEVPRSSERGGASAVPNAEHPVPNREVAGANPAEGITPPSDDKQRAEAERIAWDTIKEYGCHLPERNDVKLAKAFLAAVCVAPSAGVDAYAVRRAMQEFLPEHQTAGLLVTLRAAIRTYLACVTATPSAKLGRDAIIEACATVALEQRCERGTPWDLACVTIAEAIRKLDTADSRTPTDG